MIYENIANAQIKMQNAVDACYFYIIVTLK